MMRRTRATWVLAGLTALLAMTFGASQAPASSVGLKGGITPGTGDPPYVYEFALYLTSGSIAPGDSFTVDALVGVSKPGYITSAGSPTTQPPSNGTGYSNEYWNVPAGGIVTTPGTAPTNPTGYDYSSNVTWNYTAGPTFTYTNTPIFLGLFTVETTTDYTGSPPATIGVTTIDYSYTLGGVTGHGTTPPLVGALSVPEPSSLVLLLIGLGAFPLAWLRTRSRRPQAV